MVVRINPKIIKSMAVQLRDLKCATVLHNRKYASLL